MREYKPRIVDEILKDKLEAKGAVVLKDPNGAEKRRRQCRLLVVS